MAENKTCFIIMPISTPRNMESIYRDGVEHFKHVLDCLLVPSVEKAGFSPILPKAKGADLIQAEIIRNLEISSLVLCDISTLNPNVFYEFGIRTSLNKPLCVIKDELTVNVPFDTNILNYYEYDSSIEPWNLEKEIDRLTRHILDTYERSNGTNNMWKYFGIKSEAVPINGELSQEDRIQYLTNAIENISSKIDDIWETSPPIPPTSSVSYRPLSENDDMHTFDRFEILKNSLLVRSFSNMRIRDVQLDKDGIIHVYVEGTYNSVGRRLIQDYIRKYGIYNDVTIHRVHESIE